MRFSITNLFRSIFRRRKNQPFQAPERKEKQEQKGAGWGQRKKDHGAWIITHNRIKRTKSKKVWKRRARNKQARHSRQINRRAA